MFEGIAERAVMMETALRGQLLGGEGLLDSDSLAIEIHEMIDAKIIYISIQE